MANSGGCCQSRLISSCVGIALGLLRRASNLLLCHAQVTEPFFSSVVTWVRIGITSRFALFMLLLLDPRLNKCLWRLPLLLGECLELLIGPIRDRQCSHIISITACLLYRR